jgi:hypothetical protein
VTAEYSGTSPKKPGRGMATSSLELIEAMYSAAEAAQPITGRGIGYKLFTARLIQSMDRNDMKRVYRLLKEARERSDIPWEWIVDETRELEYNAGWDNPEQFARHMVKNYRRDFWQQQPHRVEVWSEKGTVRGVLAPVLEKYGVNFRVMHGFGSATTVNDIARDFDGRTLNALYCGDWDPSGMYMSECDLPQRLDKYDGGHVAVKRVALTKRDLRGLPSFSAHDKKGDSRYKWFVQNYGTRCWELDAMDPNDLRDRVEREIQLLIEPVAWERCDRVNRAEHESLITVLKRWKTSDV